MVTDRLICVFLGRPTLLGKALQVLLVNFLSFFSFFINTLYTALSSRAVDGQQMYSGGSVVGKASTICTEISSTPPLGGGGSKSAKSGVVFNITRL